MYVPVIRTIRCTLRASEFPAHTSMHAPPVACKHALHARCMAIDACIEACMQWPEHACGGTLLALNVL